MKIIKEFREFAMRGNVIDLAVGVIIGGAFGKIVTSFVNDILMPLIGVALGGADFKDLKVELAAAVGEKAVMLNYGMFIQNVIDFLIIAIAIFMMVKMINSLKRKDNEPPAAEPTKEQELLTEIRDLLKLKNG